MSLFKKKKKETEVTEEEVSKVQEHTEEPEKEAETKEDNKEEKEPQKEIIIREKVDEGDFYDSPEISEEELLNYNPDDEEDVDSVRKRKRENPKKKTVRNAIIISAVALVLLVVSVFFIFGGGYSFSNAMTNIENWFMGTDAGDGYPVGLTGSGADKMGFFSENGNAYVLTDSSFTAVSLSGEEIFSHRHNCSAPGISYSNGNFLIYDMGNTSYTVGSGSDNVDKFTSINNINAADISKSGKYAVFTQSQDYSSELLVYNKNDELIFTYKYAENYPVAAAVSPDGKKVCAVTINENAGELYSVLAVFNLDDTEPQAQYVSTGNFITELYWEGGTLFALGNTSAISCDSYNNFVEYKFEGSTVTAADYKDNKLFVSVSDYNYQGSCVLYIFDGSASSVRTIESSERIEDISVYGGKISLLIKKNIHCYDLNTLKETSKGSAAYDTVSIAMANDTGVYTLGVTEINYVPLTYIEESNE